MTDEKPKESADEGTQSAEKCSVLTPLAGVQLAWALTGGFKRSEVTVAEKYETQKTDGNQITVAAGEKPDEKDIVRINTSKAEELIESIGKTFPCGSAEEKYSHESAAAIRASVRNLATIYRGRDLNFKENDALRDVYMASIKEGISFGSSLNEFTKSLPRVVISGGAALIFSTVLIYYFSVTVFFLAILASISGFFLYWVILSACRWRQKRLYIRSDHERTLYYASYLRHSKKELNELHERLKKSHTTFCKNKQKDILDQVWKVVCSLELSDKADPDDFSEISTVLKNFHGKKSQEELLEKLLALRRKMSKKDSPENPPPEKKTETVKVAETTRVTEEEIDKQKVTNTSKVTETTREPEDGKEPGKADTPKGTDSTKVSGPAKEDLCTVINLVRRMDDYCPKDEKHKGPDGKTDSITPQTGIPDKEENKKEEHQGKPEFDPVIENIFISLDPTESKSAGQCIYHPFYLPQWWARCETVNVSQDPCPEKQGCGRNKMMNYIPVAIIIFCAFIVLIIIASGLLAPSAGVTLVKTMSPGENQTSDIFVTLNNAGNTEISDVFIEDTIPPAFQYGGGDLTRFVATLGPHSQTILHYTIQPRYTGQFPASPANASYSDRSGKILGIVSNALFIEASLPGAGSGTVRVYKSVNPAVMADNQTTTVEVTVENTGKDIIKNLTITDATIPDGFIAGKGNMTLTVPLLKAAESRSLHYTMQSVTSGRYILDAATVQFDNGTANSTQIPSNFPVVEVITGFSRHDLKTGYAPNLMEINQTEVADALKKAADASETMAGK
jgi:hypothetical protein